MEKNDIFSTIYKKTMNNINVNIILLSVLDLLLGNYGTGYLCLMR